jgi:hypothetical protein
MSSDRITKTLDAGQNRFELCHQAFRAIRKLHNPGNRIEDTTNDALQRLAGVGRQQVEQPENINEATAVEVKQEQFAIEAQAGELRPEQMADGVSSSDASALIATKSPTTTEPPVPNPRG